MNEIDNIVCFFFALINLRFTCEKLALLISQYVLVTLGIANFTRVEILAGKCGIRYDAQLELFFGVNVIYKAMHVYMHIRIFLCTRSEWRRSGADINNYLSLQPTS